MNFASAILLVSILVPFLTGQRIITSSNRHSQGTGIHRDWQWYLRDTPVSMNVKSAWRAGYTGRGVLVAVVDDGVNMNHPDLRSNFREDASYDFTINRTINTLYSPGSHGTMCAGIIAGGNNNNCGVGIAYNAQIASIRLYDDNTRLKDSSEARALSYKNELVDIYSNSWGPFDMGFQVKGPGPLLTKVLKEGVRLGRFGKGSIFVFAAGNGGFTGDSCAFNGYVNNIHTIAISGVSWDGSVPSYAEQCAAIMAVTYGNDIVIYRTDGNVKPPVITAEGGSGCRESFPGTSGPAAMASGIIALVLNSNPHLTWRDVQHLIARSSQPLDPPLLSRFSSRGRPRPSWRTNAANLSVSSHYGFGLMNANLMTVYAKDWVSLPEQLYISCEIEYKIDSSSWPQIPSTGNLLLRLYVSEQNCGIRFLEHVQVKVDLSFPRRGDLEMSSVSPSGTQSQLLYPRAMDSFFGYKNLKNWTVTSLHYWGENPAGNWSITIRNTKPRRNYQKGHVFYLKLILFGTKKDPLSDNPHVDRSTKTVEKVDIQQRKRDIPIHGGYSQWSYWWSSRCSKRCGGGTQNRVRSCTNPPPANRGRDCSKLGTNKQTRRCNTHPCPVHGGYSMWSSWGVCSKSCGIATQTRSRTCTNPPAAYGGLGCRRLGRATEVQRCNIQKCPPALATSNVFCQNLSSDEMCNNWKNDCHLKSVQDICAKTCDKC